MHTVLNILRLSLLLGFGFSYFIGLGWLIIDLLFHDDSTDKHKAFPLLQKIALAIVLGVIVNYGIVLIFRSLSIGLFVGGIVAILGVWRLGSWYAKNRTVGESLNKWLGVALVCSLFLSSILFEPLKDWDARSIWFFHAKMIYAAGSIGLSAGWQLPLVAFSHVDYPNLVPSIAAQITYILGYWNEYIPKISLFFILVPIVMWLFSFARKSISFVVLILIIPFSIHLWIWNGYMDGYLAMYVAVAMLLLGRYIQRNDSIDLYSSLACLAFVLCLKNEGVLALFAGVVSVAVAGFYMKKSRHADIRQHIFSWRKIACAVIVLLPFVLWTFYKRSYGLSNDLKIGTAESIANIIERMKDGSAILIFEQTYKYIEGSLLLFGLLYFVSIARNHAVPKMAVPALVTASIYYVGMFVVYLLTPYDLNWHLTFSANRTMLPVIECVFVASYYIFDSLETLQKADQMML
ncbi:MAG: hypothetical protein IPP66_12315 [Anaerolineales bacterium]|nr:hypothetical protein [Anaerolineales bacterium]